MRIVSFLMAAIALLLVVFLGIGVVWPSVSYQARVIVELPVGQVYAEYADISRWHEWITGLQPLEAGVETTLRAGVTHTLTVVDQSERTSFEQRVVEAQPDRLLTTEFELEALSGSNRVSFRRAGGSTEVVSVVTVHGKRAFLRSLLFVNKKMSERQHAFNLDRFKQLVEAQ